MNFGLTDDQQEIRRTAREFLAARYPPEEVRRLALSEERGFTVAQWEEIVELGWPELAGDESLGTVELAVLAEELGYSLAPTPLQSTWAARLLLARAGRLERLEGGRRGTVALFDADVDEPVTADPGGRLTGGKLAVPDAATAELIVVFADGRHFVLGAEHPGVAIEPVEALDPTRRLATVRFDRAAAEELDGDFEPAWQAVAIATAAETVGVAERALRMSVAHACERHQFGRPIGTNQAVSHRCAQMLLEVEGARSIVHWAAWARDHEPETADVAVPAAKAYASDCGARVTSSAMQVHGGIGFTWEHDLHLFLKRAQSNAHAYGDARFHRDRVAALVLD
jgi:alkylation response protein AidB-like acyl-CoA dehydrogenase